MHALQGCSQWCVQYLARMCKQTLPTRCPREYWRRTQSQALLAIHHTSHQLGGITVRLGFSFHHKFSLEWCPCKCSLYSVPVELVNCCPQNRFSSPGSSCCILFSILVRVSPKLTIVLQCRHTNQIPLDNRLLPIGVIFCSISVWTSCSLDSQSFHVSQHNVIIQQHRSPLGGHWWDVRTRWDRAKENRQDQAETGRPVHWHHPATIASTVHTDRWPFVRIVGQLVKQW